MPSLPARHASSASQPVPPKPHRRPVALFGPPDSDEDEYDLPGLVTTKRSVQKAPAAPSKGSDVRVEEDTPQMDNEEDTAHMDDQEDTAQTDTQEDTDNEDDDDDEEVTKKGSSSKGRAGATNITPTQWAVIVSMD
jgi:cobalamin biosynthesis protein CobT